MPGSLHEFLAGAMQKAATDLEAAFLRLPEDKRAWSPGGTARTALDMIAECAIMNDVTDVIRNRKLPDDFDYAAFCRAKAEVSKDTDSLFRLYHQNTQRGIAAILAVPEEDLKAEIPMPWGRYTVAQVMAYPYWNMSYHEGQINYIASMLDSVD